MAEVNLSKATRTHRVIMLAYADAQLLDIAGPLEVFARASRWLADQRATTIPAYSVEVVTMEGQMVVTSSGLAIASRPIVREGDAADTFLVTGGIGWRKAARDHELLKYVGRMHRSGCRFGAVCTGSLILATAGLLSGCAATTHWAYVDELQRLEPCCAADRESVYVLSEGIYTSAGVTAGIDMALALVEADHGKLVSLGVAQQLVMYLRRPGSQAQFSRHVANELRDTPFAALERWLIENLDAPARVNDLAARVGLSERHFVRRFTEEVGCSPAKWVRQIRFEAARSQVELGSPSLKDVARRCGYGDEQTLRRAFQAQLGVSPTEYATRFA